MTSKENFDNQPRDLTLDILLSAARFYDDQGKRKDKNYANKFLKTLLEIYAIEGSIHYDVLVDLKRKIKAIKNKDDPERKMDSIYNLPYKNEETGIEIFGLNLSSPGSIYDFNRPALIEIRHKCFVVSLEESNSWRVTDLTYANKSTCCNKIKPPVRKGEGIVSLFLNMAEIIRNADREYINMAVVILKSIICAPSAKWLAADFLKDLKNYIQSTGKDGERAGLAVSWDIPVPVDLRCLSWWLSEKEIVFDIDKQIELIKRKKREEIFYPID